VRPPGGGQGLVHSRTDRGALLTWPYSGHRLGPGGVAASLPAPGTDRAHPGAVRWPPQGPGPTRAQPGAHWAHRSSRAGECQPVPLARHRPGWGGAGARMALVAAGGLPRPWGRAAGVDGQSRGGLPRPGRRLYAALMRGP